MLEYSISKENADYCFVLLSIILSPFRAGRGPTPRASSSSLFLLTGRPARGVAPRSLDQSKANQKEEGRKKKTKTTRVKIPVSFYSSFFK
jgi:hypothetical protein